ncbi:hypothetical protein [Escherichia phage vB_EcoM_IME392]|nr:hypothetical protein [Escherichia phage vB_EcoM_IME392]
MDNILDVIDGTKIDEYIALALAIVGFASVLVQALEKIAKITPNTKDDEYIGVIKKYLGYASSILNFVALNLPKSTARVDKKSAAQDEQKVQTMDKAKQVLSDVVQTQDDPHLVSKATQAIDALDYGKSLIKNPEGKKE